MNKGKTMSRSLLFGAALLATVPAVAGGLRYAEDQAPGIVNPLFASTMAETRANELVFESLYTDDLELATAPALAESTELSDDKLGAIVHLRNDVSWHDGTPFTADDVVFTIKAMQDKGTASTEYGRVSFIADAVASEPYTVTFRFKAPEARPEEKLFFKILPKHLFASTAVKRTDPFRSNPVGTGPWSLSKFNDDNSISFAANPTYRDTVGISELTMREVADKNYQAKLVLYESLEALVRVLPRDLAMLQNNRKVELYPYQTNSWWYVGYNMARAPFADAGVRHAISQIVDVPSLLGPVGTGELLSGPFVPSSPYYNHDVPLPSQDNYAGEQALVGSGWAREGDEWKKGGERLQLDLVANAALESVQEVAINLQSQLQTAGIKVNVEFIDDAAWKQRVWRDKNFDLILSQWTFDRNEDIREQFHSGGTRNFTGYKNPGVDALLDKAQTASDPFARKSALRETHRVIATDQPMLFLWTLDSYAAVSVRVRDVVVHPFTFFSFAPRWQMK